MFIRLIEAGRINCTPCTKISNGRGIIMIFGIEVAMQFYFSNNNVNVAWLKYVTDFSIVSAMNFSKQKLYLNLT